jgi:NTE family protein
MNIIPPRKICLSGGGIRAVAFVGALEVLQKRKLLVNVKEYIGVSAGSLIGFLLAIGYTLSELKKIVLEFDFGLIRNLEPENTLIFLEQYGLDNGANLQRLCEVVMKQKGIPSTITFQELSEIKPPLPAFRCYATDLTTCQPREFSLKATPSVPIILALRASMCLPFYFTPIEDPITGHLLGDGGLINNYPMVFLEEDEQKYALGLMFSGEHAEQKVIEHFYDFILQIFACIYMPRIREIQKTLSENTILLPLGDFPSWNFEATKEERQILIQAALEATEDFLKRGNQRRPFRRFSVA